jgi:hypothetical protein
MHERLAGAGQIDERIALRGNFTQTAADEQNEIRGLDARNELRIGADAEIAGIAFVTRVEHVAAAERSGDRQRKFLRKMHERRTGGFVPTAAAGDHDGPLCRGEQLLQPRHVGGAGPGFHRREGRRIRRCDALDQHVLWQRDHHRAGAAAGGGVEGARDDFRYARGIVDLGRPLGHGSKDGAEVELLERLALAHLARYLPDEQDHRRGVLLRDMYAVRGVGGAGPAGNEGDAGSAGRLPDGLRHDGGAALLAADGELYRSVVESVERAEIAFARHAEGVFDAMQNQLIDQNLAAGPGAVIRAHGASFFHLFAHFFHLFAHYIVMAGLVPAISIHTARPRHLKRDHRGLGAIAPRRRA